MNLLSFAKKVFAAWLVVFLFATPVLGARVAHAQAFNIFADIPRTLEWIKNGIVDFIKNTMQAAIVTALINTVSFAADRLAYDAAVRIATGGPAEDPLYNGTPNKTYLGNLAADMAGEAIGSLSDSIEGAGGLLSNFNLCAPSSPYILLQIKLGIKGVYDRPEPKCDFNKMFGPEGTWTSFVADLADYKNPIKNQLILEELANMYDPQKSEFSASLGVFTDVFSKTAFLPFVGVQENIANSGFKPVVDFITQEQQTPAALLQKQVEDAQKNSSDVRQQATFAMLGNKDLLLQIGIRAGSVFTNTFLSKIQERIWSGLFDFGTATKTNPFDPESFSLNTQKDAAAHYRSLLTAAPLQISNYSILSEFITCPGADARGLYNCVMNSNFASAIARAEAGAPETIAEAIDDGLIDGSWPLIPSADVARNQDAYCYSYGFCYGNLVKMRKARIISIGWELAANSSENSIEHPVTLQEVLDGFDACGADGLPDSNHPWCKMIDPDWVLKYPDTQCRMQAYGEILLADQSDERGQACVDMPSCIAEDENGNCVGGYGYCVAEENTWRFRGESCPEYAASCLLFEDSEGETSALLKNTVDPGPCTADNVGCRWYASVKEEQDDGSFEFAAISSVSAEDQSESSYATRTYFNNQVEECDEEDGGCATLIVRDTDLRLNTVYNPSFEIDEDSNDHPDGWFEYHVGGVSWSSEISSDGSIAREGEVAVSPGQNSSGNGALYQPGIELGQARTYTLSFYARQLSDSGSDTIDVILDLKDEQGGAVDVSGLAISGDCDDSYTNIYGSRVSTGVGIEDVRPVSADFERYFCTFTVPPLADASLRIFGDLYLLNFDGYVDSVQLEQGEDVSIPTIGYSSDSYSTMVVKVAPAYLGCTGSADDPAECANYAQVCSERDMGCTLYTPTNGDPAISGIATELDTCPAECSGYDTYRQEATLYEPNGVDAVYFIPDTANVCSAEDVGCDEFTNLSTEEQEYYSFLRACVTEAQAQTNTSSDNEATFYTWEGSDEDGYQLRTWTLLESNLGSSDYTHIGTGGATDTAPDQAPCSNWTATNDGITCNDTADVNGDGYYDWDSEVCNSRADIFTNPNCREFYDENGNIHYRDWEKTVTVNNACQAYRKTTIAGNSIAEKETTCEDSGGYFVTDASECRYYGYREESTSCDESANGCRAYAGGRSRNSRLVFEDVFEEGTLNNWDAASAAYATYSNESLASDGHSMLITAPVTTFIADNGSICTNSNGCDETARSFGGECTVEEGSQYCGTLDAQLYAGKTYTVSVVAKGTGTLQIGFDFKANTASPTIDLPFDNAVELESGWQQINFGPLVMDADAYPLFGDGTSLVLIPTGTAYIDNVILREGEENITVIRDSWITPASCDQAPTGAESPQYYLGCQEYATQEGETAYLKSLSSLCDEDKVGCDAFFKTQESESVAAETRNATCYNIDSSTDADSDPDTATSPTACYYFTNGTGGFDTESQYLCTIAVGESSCLFSQQGFTPAWILPTHIAYGPETVIVPADQDMFLVVTDAVRCGRDTAGCTEYGSPLWSQDKESTTGAESVYLMNLPDTYDDILCAHEELFCDAFTTQDADTYYFKHPLEQTCEYRTDVTVDGTVYDGWFRTGTDNFCYGTCVDAAQNEGAACGSSADCASGETCDAGNPSYVVGGTKSGIWNNGDDAYRAWAGTCSANYDTCTEFQDILAQDDGDLYGQTTGTSYFYLNNENLSEYGLSDSQKCDGQVSLKNGCAMFYDTGDTSLVASASATEMASRHADALFGSEPYGLVDPIDCENAGDTTIVTSSGDEIDLCATRCVYDYGEIYDLSDGTTYREKLSDERTSSTEYGRDDLYIFGGSCYESTDCPTVRSESGKDVEAVTCATQVRVDPYSSSSSFGGSFGTWRANTVAAGYDEVPRLENDANSVLKVNRDRSCSEWLSCSSTTTQWDENTASFVTTCNDIALCTGYDAASGSTFCSSWDFEKPEVIYDATWYASRDTSWYGNEYSGMAIPNMFPVQSLSQANVSPELYCVNTYTNEIYEDGVCTAEGDSCGSTLLRCMTFEDAVDEGALNENGKDYALVLNAGGCSGDYGVSCAVGYCEDTGAACATSDQCSSGPCLVGSCYNVDETATCQTALDCDEGQVCYGGACADVGENVEIEDYEVDTGASSCASGETFVQNAELKIGSCINTQCLLTPDGETYENGTTEGKICRAYPENNSPFSNDVVEDWYDSARPGSRLTSGDEDEASLPYDFVSGFENTETCQFGEDCDCSYTKVTFGKGQETRYYGLDWNPDFGICGGNLDDVAVADAGDICTEDSDCDSLSCVNPQGNLGVCSSGDRAGGYCTENEQCGEGNLCAKSTREDVIYGLNGFCLEHDTSMNILGDRNKKACISWLPVDQLAGDTDLRAKYTSAGFFNDAYACADVRLFADVYPTSIPEYGAGRYSEGDIACAEPDRVISGADVGKAEVFDTTVINECATNLECPNGFWALLGMPAWQGAVDAAPTTMSGACTEDSGGGDADGINDCPYVCIPYGAVDDTSGLSCDPTAAGGIVEEALTAQDTEFLFESSISADNVYFVGESLGDPSDASYPSSAGYEKFDYVADALRGCSVAGVEYSDAVESVLNLTFYERDEDYRYYELRTNALPYAGCRDVLQVADANSQTAYAFTDTLFMTGKSINDTSYDHMRFDADTLPGTFGFSLESPTLADGAVAAAMCGYDAGGSTDPDDIDAYSNQTGEDLNLCSGTYLNSPDLAFTHPENATGRAFIPFTIVGQGVYWPADTYDLWNVTPSSGTAAAAFERINQIFAAADIGVSNTLFTWSGTSWGSDGGTNFAYEEGDAATTYGAYDVRAEEGNPPRVWSVDVRSCSDDGTLCEEGIEDRITVNSDDSSNLLGSQFFNATVKFYAAADKNQLPIRRIIVDWGDDPQGGKYSGSDSPDNFYKNARGLQDGTQASKCSLGTEWGLTDESCDPYYFSYNHIYTCSSEVLSDETLDCNGDGSTGDSRGNFPCRLDQSGDGVADACVFKPRVHIRDNWGWCTGTCEVGNGADEDRSGACYAGGGNDLGTSATYAQSECSYEAYPEDSPSINPWIEYVGVITVTP